MSPLAPADITAQLAAARGVLERHLSGAMQSLHLFGSAVAGGLKPRSDIDLLVSVDAPLAEPLRRALMTDLLAVSAWPGSNATLRALEVTVVVHGDVVPWRYPPRREMQFGEWGCARTCSAACSNRPCRTTISRFCWPKCAHTVCV